MKISIKTIKKRQVVDITQQVQSVLTGTSNGLCTLAALHTTVALTLAEGNPDTNQDLLAFLENIVPAGAQWQHASSEHASDHFLAAIIGASLSLPIENGQLVLGTWQRIVLVELDGPKTRNLNVALSQ